MEPDVRARLEELMALMAEDRAFVFTFMHEFGDHLARTVRWHLRELSRDDVAHDRREFEALITDVGLFIQANASAWSPEGALPWTWAQRGIRALISVQVGPRVVDGEQDLGSEASDAVGVVGLGAGEFADLAQTNCGAALILELVAQVASPRDREIYLLYRQQRRDGDPSPSETVKRALPEYNLTSANIRKICQRVGVAVASALQLPRYRSIANLPFWAA